MLEVNAIYFVLLVEAFGLLLILILLWILLSIFRLRRKRNAIRQLAQRLSKDAASRSQQNEAFLQAVYRFEGGELRAVLQDIEKHEADFFQILIDALRQGKNRQIDELDAALARVMASYKCLQPRAEAEREESGSTDAALVQREVETLRSENDELRSELYAAQTGLNDMLAEFGNMFGGGKDHELDLHDLKKKLAALQAGSGVDIKLMG